MRRQALDSAFPFAIAALGFVVIAPTLWSGWLGDDAFYSVLDGILGADRVSLLHAMRHSFDLWFFGEGRFYPGLILEKYLVFAIFTNLLAYKLLLVAATLGDGRDVPALRRGVCDTRPRESGGAHRDHAFCRARAITTRSCRIMRCRNSSRCSCWARCWPFDASWTKARPRWRVASIALYAVAALTYEDAYAFCLLYPIVAATRERSWPQALRTELAVR